MAPGMFRGRPGRPCGRRKQFGEVFGALGELGEYVFGIFFDLKTILLNAKSKKGCVKRVSI